MIQTDIGDAALTFAATNKNRWHLATTWLCIALTVLMTGCHKELIDQPLLDQYEMTKDNIYYKGEPRPLRYYKDYATGIEYPTECHIPDSGVTHGFEPRSLSNRRNDEVLSLTLQQAIEVALTNNEVVRDDLQFRSLGNSVLANPLRTPSVYDPAIQETGVLFGNRGVEAALSDFDTRLTTRMTWGKSEQIQNSAFLNLNAGDTLTDETGDLSTRLEKTFANSGTFSLQHDWSYSLNNVPVVTKQFNSAYDGFLQAEYRQPLGAGGGTEFTRIAGPISNTLTGVSGVSQGVVISKINNDIAIADFESNIVRLVKSVEDVYWDLYLSYQVYQAEIDAMEDAVRNLEKVKIRIEADDLEPVAEQQATANYLDSKIRVMGSLADIYQSELRLRRLLGLQVNDGKIIRPSDAPTIADYVPDWHVCLAEALSRRIELRSHKWSMKSLEKQLWAARSLVRPRVDGVINYRINAFGDKLLGDGAGGTPSAYESLTDNQQTSWTAGFDVSIPFGFRAAHSQVINYEYQLVKARKVLVAQEQEVSHELAFAFGELDRWKTLADDNIRRQDNMDLQIRKIQLKFDTSSETRSPEAIDLLQRAHLSLRDIRIAYYRSMIEYNKAITEIHFRKGTLLENNNIHLKEGLWKAASYKDALRRAWERSYADDAPMLKMKPMGFISRYRHPAPIPDVAPATRIPEPNLYQGVSPTEELPAPGEIGPDLPKQGVPNDPQVPVPTEVGDPDVARPYLPGRKNVTRRDTTLQQIGHTQSAPRSRAERKQPVQTPTNSRQAGRVRLSAPPTQAKNITPKVSSKPRPTANPNPTNIQRAERLLTPPANRHAVRATAKSTVIVTRPTPKSVPAPAKTSSATTRPTTVTPRPATVPPKSKTVPPKPKPKQVADEGSVKWDDLD